MTNREQVAWAFGFGDYDDCNVAETVSDMLDASGAAFLDSADRKSWKSGLVWIVTRKPTTGAFWRMMRNEGDSIQHRHGSRHLGGPQDGDAAGGEAADGIFNKN